MTTEMLACSKCISHTQDCQRQGSPGWLAVGMAHLYLTTRCKPPSVHAAPQTRCPWICTASCLSNSSVLFCLGLLRLRCPFRHLSIQAEGSDAEYGEGSEKQTACSVSLLPAFLTPDLLSQGRWHTSGSKLFGWSDTVADTLCGTQVDADVPMQSSRGRRVPAPSAAWDTCVRHHLAWSRLPSPCTGTTLAPAPTAWASQCHSQTERLKTHWQQREIQNFPH